MGKLKLFYSQASPFVRKVHVVAMEVGATADLEIADINVQMDQVNEELEAISPIAKIPTLLTDDGKAIYDSSVICSYLANKYDGWKIYGESHDDHIDSERQQALCDGICEAAVALQYEKVKRPEHMQWPEWMDRQAKRIIAGVKQLERERDELTSDKIGGLAAIIALDYLDFRHANLDWRGKCPDLVTWYDANTDRPSLLETRPV